MNVYNQRQLRVDSIFDFAASFLAGSLTLGIQLCFTRIGVQYFGSDSVTISAIIISVLLGLSLGAAFFGRLSDRTKSLSTLLGFMFIIPGVLTVPAVACHEIIADWSIGVGEWIGNPAMFGPIFFVIVTTFPISFFLGGIVPALVKRRTLLSGKRSVVSFGAVYALETLGAAVGSIATAFVLIQWLGINQLLVFCGTVSICTGMLFFLVKTASGTESSRRAAARKIGWRDGILLTCIAMASCTSLGMEVVWQRFFVVWFGSDTQSFAIVVASILTGVSLGALVSTRIVGKKEDLAKVYGAVLMLIAISIVSVTYVVAIGFDNLASWQWSYHWLTGYPIVSRFVLAMALMIVPTTLIGIGLPVAANIWVGENGNTGSQIGQVYATALAGNVVGVWLCGFVLISNIGLRPAAVLLSGLCLLASLVVAILFPGNSANRKSKSYRWFSIVSVGVGWMLISNALTGQRSQLGLISDRANWQTLFYSENSRNTVAVIQSNANKMQRQMMIDGVSIGGSGGGVDKKQQLLAHLPFLVQKHDDQRNVLTIGLGSGILAGELLEIPWVKNVCCVELSEAVIKAAEYFSDLNGDLLSQPDFELIHADGIQFLRRTDREFDVIVSDAKSRPGHSGNVVFFARDYYQLCRSRMSEHGIFVQWISLKSSTQAIRTILRTFCEAFPYGHIAMVGPDSIFVVGSKTELDLEREYIDHYLAQPFSQSLKRYDFNGFEDVVSVYWLDQTSIKKEIQNDPVNTFDRPVLEFYSLKSFQGSTENSIDQLGLIFDFLQTDMKDDFQNSRFNGRAIDHEKNSRLIDDLIAGRRGGNEILKANLIVQQLPPDWLDQAARQYRLALKLLPGMTRQLEIARIYRQLVDQANRDGKMNLEFSALFNIRELQTATANEEIRMAEILESLSQGEQALDFYYQAIKKEPQESQHRLRFAYCLLGLDKSQQAAAQFQRIVAKSPNDAEARIGLGIAQLRVGMEQDGMENIRSAIENRQDLKSRLIEFDIRADMF